MARAKIDKASSGIVINERESAEHGDIFAKTERDIRKRFWRCVAGQTRGRFGRVRNKTRSAREQSDDHGESRTRMSQHLNGEQRAADRTDDGVHGVPGGIDPRNFVGEKFEEIENAGDRDDHRDGRALRAIDRRGERDPVEMNGEAGGENGEVKIDPGESSQAKGHAEKMQFFHEEIIGARE